MAALGLEFLTVMGLPPVAFVELASTLGCGHISTTLSGPHLNAGGYPDFDFRDDMALRRDMIAAMRDLGVSISLGEGFLVQAGADVRALAADLDLFRALGAQRVNVISMDPDFGRTLDQYAVFAEMADAAGIDEVVTEFVPIMTVRDLPMALEAVRHVGRDDFRLLIDTMHLCRTGSTVQDIAALDPSLIGYIQLCDVPAVPVVADYMTEAMTDRRAPGEGELPLADLLAALPNDRVVSLEVPQCAKVAAGLSCAEITAATLAAARALLQHREG